MVAYRVKKNALVKTEKHRQKRREYMQKWREANREKHNALARASHAKHKHKHVHKQRARHLKKQYGLTVEQYELLHQMQNGLCYICRLPERGGKTDRGRRLAVDHCHKTGLIRGLLCSKCNGSLGWYEKHAVAVVAYLNSPPAILAITIQGVYS